MSAESALRDGNAPGLKLIETLRWEPTTGFLRLDRHLARMAASAATLDFVFRPDDALRALDGVANGETALRVRLALAQDGSCAVTTQDFVDQGADAIWTLRVARSTLDSRYGMLRHKTTRRGLYEAARAEFSRKEADEVILANERGNICEGTITNIFIEDAGGPLLTPALPCGLLPGVLRAEMLEQGKAREAVISKSDLYEAKTVFVGNSLRGLIRGRLP